MCIRDRVKRVDKNPKLKSTAGPWYYSWAALSGYYRNYLRLSLIHISEPTRPY